MTDAQLAVDRQDLVEVLVRFHRAVDAHDWPTLRTALLDDAIEWESIATDPIEEMRDTISGRETFVSWLEQVTTGSYARHLTSNHLVTVDGDDGGTESFMLVIDPATLATLATGTVTARYRRGPDSWRITHLRIEEEVGAGTVALMAAHLGLQTSKRS